MKVCDVSGMRLPNKEFYAKQSHCRFIDNLRRKNNFTKKQLKDYLS